MASLVSRAVDRNDGDGPSRQFKGDAKPQVPQSPYGSGGDGTLASLSNIRPLLTRTATVWAVTILFFVCYLVPSRLRALAENSLHLSRGHAAAAAAAKALELSAATQLCDRISLKQQNITSRVVNIVSGSFGHSSTVVAPGSRSPAATVAAARRALASSAAPGSSSGSGAGAGAGAGDLTRLVQLLDAYRLPHSAGYLDGIQDKNLCKRKFVLGSYSCPMQAGERIHEFLNAYAGAVITNRTLLWRYCGRKGCQGSAPGNDEGSCAGLLQRLPWIPSAQAVFNAWPTAAAPWTRRKSTRHSSCPSADTRPHQSPSSPAATLTPSRIGSWILGHWRDETLRRWPCQGRG